MATPVEVSAGGFWKIALPIPLKQVVGLSEQLDGWLAAAAGGIIDRSPGHSRRWALLAVAAMGLALLAPPVSHAWADGGECRNGGERVTVAGGRMAGCWNPEMGVLDLQLESSQVGATLAIDHYCGGAPSCQTFIEGANPPGVRNGDGFDIFPVPGGGKVLAVRDGAGGSADGTVRLVFPANAQGPANAMNPISVLPPEAIEPDSSWMVTFVKWVTPATILAIASWRWSHSRRGRAGEMRQTDSSPRDFWAPVSVGGPSSPSRAVAVMPSGTDRGGKASGDIYVRVPQATSFSPRTHQPVAGRIAADLVREGELSLDDAARAARVATDAANRISVAAGRYPMPVNIEPAVDGQGRVTGIEVRVNSYHNVPNAVAGQIVAARTTTLPPDRAEEITRAWENFVGGGGDYQATIIEMREGFIQTMSRMIYPNNSSL